MPPLTLQFTDVVVVMPVDINSGDIPITDLETLSFHRRGRFGGLRVNMERYSPLIRRGVKQPRVSDNKISLGC